MIHCYNEEVLRKIFNDDMIKWIYGELNFFPIINYKISLLVLMRDLFGKKLSTNLRIHN